MIPRLPPFLVVSRLTRDSPFIRSILIVDETKRTKPLFSWYNPYEPTWIPVGWLNDTVRTLKYYFER